MIKKDVIETIADLNFWNKDQDVGIYREDYLKSLETLIEAKNFAVSIIGVRRAGKTFLSKQILKRFLEKGMDKEQTLYVNFEEPSFRPYLSDVEFLNDIYESYRYFLNEKERAILVLDEVQNVENWESWVRIMLERRENIKIILTGSSSKLLSKELATKLTGRTLTLKIFPLSFKEFLKFKNFEIEKKHQTVTRKKDLMKLFREYLEFGSFPEVVLNEKREIKTKILKELFDSVITRDIVERYNIRQSKILKSLAALTIQNFSSYTSVPKLVNIFENVVKRKISPTLINQYLEYFSQAFLLFLVPIFSVKVKEQLLYPKKLYCVDNGLINAVSFKFSEDLGKLAENLVFLDLLRKQLIKPELEVYYWKKSDKEVDFVLKEGLNVKKLIQVCWNVTERKTKEREVNNLLTAINEFKLKEGLILTEDFEHEEKVNGKRIIYMPLWKWLLSDY